MLKKNQRSKERTAGNTHANTSINGAEDKQSGGSPKNIEFIPPAGSQTNENPASVGYDRTSNIVSLDDAIRAYHNFSQIMGDKCREGSLGWLESQRKKIFLNSANGADKNVEEMLRLVHERLLQRAEEQKEEEEGEEGEKEDRGETAVPGGVVDLYWMGRRSLPEITEKEVEEAVAKLTDAERTLLCDEFNAMQHDGFVMLEDEKILSSMVERSKKNVNGNQSLKSEAEDTGDEAAYDTPEGPEVPDGNSVIFGNHVVEITIDKSQWSLYQNDELPISIANFRNTCNDIGVNPFETTETSESNNEASSPTPSPKQEELKSPAPPATPEVTPLMEQNAFIRNRVRMMLIANRVAKSYEEELTKTLFDVGAGHTHDREQALRRLIEAQNQTLEEAIRVASAIPLMERQLMAQNVDDPYSRQQWQRDESVTCCHNCRRLFTLIITRHHCRRCGIIYCHNCSAHAGILPDRRGQTQTSTPLWNRLCEKCYNICCVHRRRVNESTEPLRGGYERDGRAPKDPILAVLTCCPNTDKMTLEDGFPPFYVVLPEEWYALSTITFSGWVNALRRSPYKVVESLHDGTTNLAGTALSKLYRWLTGVIYSGEERASRR
ncbi:FYVE zinc finger [Trypanosoma melophagium]|uniref:FYVE zinc finger n=1 Tax=Trypanosoma melophagium TaxID=715481 RepID=UPI00351A2C33|nr:FYVE zinc finger [Trypanosoma melophagium]